MHCTPIKLSHAATLALAALIMEGCATDATEIQTAPPNPFFIDLQLAPPNTARGFLHNVRAVLERGDLKRRSFFTQELLTATFGGSTVNCHEYPGSLLCSLESLDYLDGDARTTFRFSWSNLRNGDPDFSNFSIACKCGIRGSDVEAAFGNVDRTVRPDRRLANTHYPVPPPATDPMGNLIVIWTTANPIT